LLAPQFLGPFALPYWILIALRLGKGKPEEREDLPGDSTESGLS